MRNIKLLRWKSKFGNIRHFSSAFIFYVTMSLLRVTFLDNGKITVFFEERFVRRAYVREFSLYIK